MTAADLPGAIEAIESAAYDITDAIEAVTEFLALAPDEPDDVSILNSEDVEVDFVIGHLRAILAALSGPYVPGMARVTGEEYAKVANDAPGGHLFLFDPTVPKAGEHVYFTAVTE